MVCPPNSQLQQTPAVRNNKNNSCIITTPPCSTSDRKNVLRKSVTFSSVAQMRMITNIHDYFPSSREMEEALWYQRTDYQQFKVRDLRVVEEMLSITNNAIKDDSWEDNNTVTSRGLESRTKEGFQRKLNARIKAANAVLDEQYEQWQNDDSDPERIAMKYTLVSLRAAWAAYQTGLKDEQFVLEEQIYDIDQKLGTTTTGGESTESLSSSSSSRKTLHDQIDIMKESSCLFPTTSRAEGDAACDTIRRWATSTVGPTEPHRPCRIAGVTA